MRVKNFKDIRFEIIDKMPVSLFCTEHEHYYLTLAVVFFDVLLQKIKEVQDA